MNLTSGARSTRSEKSDENKPKCWKFANNGYLAYHLRTQNLPDPRHGYPGSKQLFEDGEFIYDVVFLVFGEHRADQNPHRKIGKNCLDNRNHPKCPISRSYSFLHRTQNHAKSVLLERRQCRISIDTKINRIQAWEDLEILA